MFAKIFNGQNVSGIHVFLEFRRQRIPVGTLFLQDSQFVFEYQEAYLSHPKAIPLGPELPLTQKKYSSPTLFPSFEDRIPSRHNPAYASYCHQFDIESTEKDPFVLLATIGRRGPSSFVFEPLWSDSFKREDLKAWRKALGLSTRDFAAAFGLSQATVVRLENGTASGADVLKTLELFYRFPEAAAYQIRRYGSALHTQTKKRVLELLGGGKK